MREVWLPLFLWLHSPAPGARSARLAYVICVCIPCAPHNAGACFRAVFVSCSVSFTILPCSAPTQEDVKVYLSATHWGLP
eukprot:6093624-Pleurochrysis_carterae.AAC.1